MGRSKISRESREESSGAYLSGVRIEWSELSSDH